MSKRLQVVLDDAEYAEIKAIAKRHGESVSQWVRGALLEVRTRHSKQEQGRKLAVLREALTHHFPSGDIDEMLAETQCGYRR